MENSPVVDHAERVLLMALTRWQLQGTGSAGSGITSVHIDDLFRELQRFKIESVVRVAAEHVGVPPDEAAKLQRIEHAFEARVTLDVCDRNATEIGPPHGVGWIPAGRQILRRLYYVRQHADDQWIVFLANRD